MKLLGSSKLLVKFFILSMCVLTSLTVNAAPDSKGKEFIFAFQNNYTGTSKISLFITSDIDTQGIVEVPGYEVSPGASFSYQFSVVANTVTTVELPNAIQRLSNNGTASLGVHILANDEITVYGVNLQKYTSDAFLALPVDVLSNEYIAMSYDGLAQFASSNLTSQVAIIANADNTLVEITPADDVDGNLKGQPFNITLNQFDVYQLNTAIGDLTGTIIRSSSPVAVMAGQKCADVPSLSRSPTGGRIGWCDHLVEMMPPLNTWGQSFAVIPLASRLKGSIARIMSSENGVRVKYGESAEDTATLNQGEFVEVVLTEYSEIVATGPVLVSQYSPGQAFDGVAADPFMMLVPPNEQFLQSYNFATPEKSFNKHFVNVAVPTTALANTLLDGQPVDPSLFTPIGGGGLSGAQLPLAEGSHSISSSQPLGIYVYGFNSYDSYGYPGGMSLAVTNPLGDSFAPNIGAFRQIGRTLLGAASDSEDVNVNGILDSGEDVNNNGVLDRRSEDLNSNGQLDAGEDLNGDGILDRDRGVFKIELLANATNVTLEVVDFIAGQSPQIRFKLDLIDNSVDGSGRIRVEDLNGNATEQDVFISAIAVLSDVQLMSTVSGDRIEIDPSSYSHTPKLVTVQSDSTIVEWQFDSIRADQLENISFDVVLVDPLPGEQRTITQSLQLSYINALGGERISTELGKQIVEVSATSFDLSVTTNQLNYSANSTATFEASVTNIGTAINSGSLEFVIEDELGASVTAFTPVAIDALAASDTISKTQSWDTNLSIAGVYQIRAVLRDSGGNVVNQALSVFSIVNSTQSLPNVSIDTTVGINDGSVFIAKSTYNINDFVQVQSRIRNLTLNTITASAELKIIVLDPNGLSVFTQTQVVDETLPGIIRDVVSQFILNDATPGNYQVQVTIIDPESSAILANTTSVFSVERDLALAVEGNVTALHTELLRGQVQDCTYNVRSLINGAIDNLPIRQRLINVSTQAEINTRDVILNLQSGQNVTETHQEISADIPGADYACVLQINTGTEYKTLAFAAFTVFKDISQSLVGQVDVADTELLRGDNQVCTYSVSSKVSTPLSNVPIHHEFINKDLSSVVNSRDLLVNIIPNQTNVDVRNEDTSATPIKGNYACSLQVLTDTGLKTLNEKSFVLYNLIANPGSDQTAFVSEQVTLDASGSRETDGLALTYQWQIVSKPADSTTTLSDVTAVNPNFYIDQQGDYVIELVVNNGSENSLPKRVRITAPNRVATANAGLDQAVNVGDNVALDASGSFDLDGDPLQYQWTIIQKPTGSQAGLSNSGLSNPVINIDSDGLYRIQLIVNDGFSNSAPDTVLLNVGNVPPVANAGIDIVALVGDSITLNGSNSHDDNGDLVTYIWSFDSIPANSQASLINTATAKPNFIIDQAGDYIARLIVSDGVEFSAADTVTISVGNAVPTANAGIDQSALLGSNVTLDGSLSSDLNGDALSYRWSLIGKPTASNAQLNNLFISNPQFNLDVQGDYIIQLIVNDGTIDSQPDTVFVTVGNLKPVANATSDVVGDIYTGDTIQLDGLNSFDPDGGNLTYQWTFVDKPSGSLSQFNDSTSATPSFDIDVSGDYVVQLVVNDGLLDSDISTVFINGVQSCIDNLAIRPKFNKLTLTWTDNPDVEFVEVERATAINGPYEVIAESTSTYATYQDAGLSYGSVYYYRIRGTFPIDNNQLNSGNIVQCTDLFETVICGDSYCNTQFDVASGQSYLQCSNLQRCDILGREGNTITASCGGTSSNINNNSCQVGDDFCQFICQSLIRDPVLGESLSLFNNPELFGGEFDFNQCLPPTTEQRICKTQIIASTPIGRVRTVRIPDVVGMTVDQAQQTIRASRLRIGTITFERTTAITQGQVIRQDMPRNSVMPRNTSINLVIATRGIN